MSSNKSTEADFVDFIDAVSTAEDEFVDVYGEKKVQQDSCG